MAFSLPADLPTNWQDNIGMIENAAFLNNVGTMGNSIKSVVNSTVTGVAAAYVPTGETTTSTSYVDLATTTDYVTVTISSSGMALVFLYAAIYNDSVGGISYCGYAMSGANTAVAADAQAISAQIASPCPNAASFSGIYMLTGLAAGSTTFKMKYRVSGGTGKFTYRRITVVPFF